MAADSAAGGPRGGVSLTLRNRTRFWPFLTDYLGILLALFVLTSFVAVLILSTTPLRPATIPLGLLVGLLVCGPLVGLKYRQFAPVWRHATLTLDADGMVLRDNHLVLRMPWASVQGFGVADAVAGRTVSRAPGTVSGTQQQPGGYSLSPVFSETGGVSWAEPGQPVSSIIGTGELEVPPSASWSLRRQIDQVAAINREHRPHLVGLHAVAPEQYEREWRSGRVGDFLREHRPDLAGQLR